MRSTGNFSFFLFSSNIFVKLSKVLHILASTYFPVSPPTLCFTCPPTVLSFSPFPKLSTPLMQLWHCLFHGFFLKYLYFILPLKCFYFSLLTQLKYHFLWSDKHASCMLSCSVVSDSLRLHGLEPTRLLCPWDFPGKSTDCCCSVAKLCPTFCDPMNCSMPGFPILHYLLESDLTHVHWVSDAIQPTHPLVIPLSSCPQSFPSSGYCSG